jgi:undecaprenyl-diphosphatase
MDAAIVLWLAQAVTAHEPLGAVVALAAQDGIFLLPVVLAAVWLLSRQAGRTRQAVLVGCVAAVAAIALGLLLEHVLARPRPFVALEFAPLVPHAADSSFPSDHTLTGVALVGALLWRAPLAGSALVLWALFVGACRVAAGLHYPSDILGSAVLALALDAAAWRIVPPVTQHFLSSHWPAGNLTL